ncbi:hypothetical protein B9Z55_015295 [Caenorhabditis nigoni]|uniref:Uncharacterized protein n=1 Tax=Caenorhabditis nigoni TaxID=1611254 RepID=A0A2G5UAB5_9PELO|nr:hypothetical protein B9Z55_015295 [Caenorhabditis nigoni]
MKHLKEVWTIPKLEMQTRKTGCERTLTVLNAILEGNIKIDQEEKKTGVFIANRRPTRGSTSQEFNDTDWLTGGTSCYTTECSISQRGQSVIVTIITTNQSTRFKKWD